MKILKQFWAWWMQNGGKIAILAIVVLLILFWFGNKISNNQESEYEKEIAIIETKNELLSSENAGLLSENEVIKDENNVLQKRYDSSEEERDALAGKLEDAENERDSIKDIIQVAPINELYTYLDQIRYPFSGEKLYRFNEPQVRKITQDVKDYDVVKREMGILEKSVAQSDVMIAIGDSIRAKLQRQVINLEEVNLNNDDIILNLEQVQELSEDEIRRLKNKLFWRTAGLIAVDVLIVAGVIILVL